MVPASNLCAIVHADVFLLVPLVGAGIGLALFYLGFRSLQQKGFLQHASTSIGTAAPGLIEVNGVAVGPYTLTAPLSGKSCYYYRAIAWELRKSDGHEDWKKIVDESFHVPFYVDDGTGKLLVDAQEAEVDIPRAVHEEYATATMFSEAMPSRVTTFLTRQGVSGGSALKLDEYCIQPKAPLSIVGTLAENDRSAVTPRAIPSRQAAVATLKLPLLGKEVSEESSAQSTRLGTKFSIELGDGRNSAEPVSQETIYLSPESKASSAREMTQQGKIAAALMRAGISRPATWAAVERPAAAVAVSVQDHTSEVGADNFDLQPKFILRKGEKNASFVISSSPAENADDSTMGWTSFAYICSGPVLVLFSIYALLARLGWL
jgi:hypothetical protein